MNRLTLRLAALALATLVCTAGAFAAETTEEQPKPWPVKGELSYVRTDGNTDTETFGARIGYEGDYAPNRYYFNAGALYAETDDEKTTDRLTADARYERVFTDRFFGFLEAAYLRDPFAGFDARYSGGPGLGYEIIKTEAHQLKGLASMLYVHENPVGDADNNNYASAKAAIDYRWQISDTVQFKELADYSRSLDDGDVYFINSETTLEVKLVGNLALAMGYIVRYQNDPTDPEAEKTDRTFLTSLVFEF
jgi:putative salt-induced outer membrane protein